MVNEIDGEFFFLRFFFSSRDEYNDYHPSLPTSSKVEEMLLLKSPCLLLKFNVSFNQFSNDFNATSCSKFTNIDTDNVS